MSNAGLVVLAVAYAFIVCTLWHWRKAVHRLSDKIWVQLVTSSLLVAMSIWLLIVDPKWWYGFCLVEFGALLAFAIWRWKNEREKDE